MTVADENDTSILRWRFWQLMRGGFTSEQAITLASEPGVDLHEAVDLVARGCPPPLALRILL